MYLDWYILKNTESVVSGLIQTKVLLQSIEFKGVVSWLIDTDEYRECCISVDRFSLIQRVMYLDWYLLENKESCIWIDTNLRIQRLLYLDWYLLENKESYIRIDTNLRIQRLLYLDWYLLENKESCIWIETNLRIQRVLYLESRRYIWINTDLKELLEKGICYRSLAFKF